MKLCDGHRIQDYLLGALAADDAAAIEVHIAGCRSCARQIEEYRGLFSLLAELPAPPIPEGLEAAIMSDLSGRGLRVALLRRFAHLVRQPVVAGAAGAIAGLGLVVFRDTILLFMGRLMGGVVVAWTGDLIQGLTDAITGVRQAAFIAELFLHLSLKLEPLYRAPGQMLKAVPGGSSVLSIALGLATLLFLGRLVGQIRREKLSHAER